MKEYIHIDWTPTCALLKDPWKEPLQLWYRIRYVETTENDVIASSTVTDTEWRQLRSI